MARARLEPCDGAQNLTSRRSLALFRDLMTLAEACKLARRASTPHLAAQSIVEKAYYRGMAKYERLKDDTTCLVVDLNPSQMSFVKPPPGDSGCCQVM